MEERGKLVGEVADTDEHAVNSTHTMQHNVHLSRKMQSECQMLDKWVSSYTDTLQYLLGNLKWVLFLFLKGIVLFK